MLLDSSLESFKDIEEDGDDVFKSLLDVSSDNSNLSRNQCTVQNQQDLKLSKAFDSSELNRMSGKSMQSGDEKSDSSTSELQQPLVPLELKPQYSKQFHNRLEQLLQRSRPRRKVERQNCSLDTSAALIRLMSQRPGVKQIFNLYILLNILLRGSYIALTLYYFSKVESNDRSLYIWSGGGFIFARLMFIFTVMKLLNLGERTKDKKIKIVYDTYVQWFDDINAKIRQLERDSTLIRRTQEDEEQYFKQSQEIKSLQKWVICLKTYIILIPPELSFVYLKKQSNGFFQVQNLIVKSLEVFFYMPTFLYFLKSQTKSNNVLIFDFSNHEVQNVFSIMITFDIALFIIVSTYLICFGNRKFKIKPIK